MESGTEKPKKIFTVFTTTALVIFVAVIVVNFYILYFQKDYEFIVESPCDSAVEECFQRDCSNLDDCPPNEFSTFKRYSLNASDFQSCTDEDCTKACESESISCEKIACEEDIEAGEICTSISDNNDEPVEE